MKMHNVLGPIQYYFLILRNFYSSKSASIPNSTQYRSKTTMDRVQRQYSESVLNTCVISFNQKLKYYYGDGLPAPLSSMLLY